MVSTQHRGRFLLAATQRTCVSKILARSSEFLSISYLFHSLSHLQKSLAFLARLARRLQSLDQARRKAL
jgi:hypothetical protein